MNNIRSKRNEKDKEQKIRSHYRSKINIPINIKSFPCPICGKNMKFITNTKTNSNYLVCDECDMKAKVRILQNGDVVLLSTPANRKTRQLRNEAHFYFDKLYTHGIFKSREQAYVWLADKLFFGVDIGIHHIGEMNEEFCRKTIRECILCLVNNRARVGHIQKYCGCNSYTSSQEDLMILIQSN